MKLDKISCPTPACAEQIAKYGDGYRRVVDRPGGAALCEGCGGAMTPDGVWHHVCQKCGREVEPGTLAGLFVPHVCSACWKARVDADRLRGNFCLKCGATRSECCC